MHIEDITQAMNDGNTWFTVFYENDFWRVKLIGNYMSVYDYPDMNPVMDDSIIKPVTDGVHNWILQTNG